MSRAGLFAACAVAAVIGVTGSTPAIASPSIGLISEFPIPTASSNPSWITGGLPVSANGDLWFTQQPNTPAPGNTGAVAKITTSGVITEYTTGITPGSGPSSIAADGSGNMWFTEADGNQIAKITAAGVVTEYPLPVAGSRPAGIALGADGNMWFTLYDSGNIGSITPAGLITEYPTGLGPTAGPYGIALGPDGNMWFTQLKANAIGVITPTGQVTTYSTGITPASSPYIIASGLDGRLWFTQGESNTIGAITTDGQVTQYPYPGDPANAGSNGLALGADGNMWFGGGNSGPGGTQVMGRMTPTGAVKLFGTGASSNPFGVALGSDGRIWFTNYQGNNTIGRMYTSARQLPVNCGALPTRIAARGETVLFPGDCLTNAGNRLRISVAAVNPARGSAQDFRLKRGPGGKISIRTFGTSPLKLSITAQADRTGVYPAYSFTRTVSVGRS
jgi:virginiamycin B lyase